MEEKQRRVNYADGNGYIIRTDYRTNSTHKWYKNLPGKVSATFVFFFSFTLIPTPKITSIFKLADIIMIFGVAEAQQNLEEEKGEGGEGGEEEKLKIQSEILLSGTYFLTLMRGDTTDLSQDEISIGSGVFSSRVEYRSIIGGKIMLGVWQFPSVGVEGINPKPSNPVISFPKTITSLFLPMAELIAAYIDINLSDDVGLPISIQAGRLITNVGGEVALTVQNINIQRGIVWYAEPAFYNGVRINIPLGKNTFYIGGIRGIYDSQDGKPALEIGLILQDIKLEKFSVALNSIISDKSDADKRNLVDIVLNYAGDFISTTFYTDLLSDSGFENKAIGSSLLTLFKKEMFGLGFRAEFVYNINSADLYGLGKWGGTATLTPTLFIREKAFIRGEFSSAYSPDKKFQNSEGIPTPFQMRIGFEVGGTF